jgi:hypothetical protein
MVKHVDIVENDFVNFEQRKVATVHDSGGELLLKDAISTHEDYLAGVVASVNREIAPAKRLTTIIERVSGDYLFATAPHKGKCPFENGDVVQMKKRPAGS